MNDAGISKLFDAEKPVLERNPEALCMRPEFDNEVKLDICIEVIKDNKKGGGEILFCLLYS